MCVLSVIYDYGRGNVTSWTQPMLDTFKELAEKAKEFDKVAKQPDCEDPAKADYLKRIEERLARLEEQLTKQ